MVEPNNNSEEHMGTINLKDIDELLELFNRLQELSNPEKPSKNQNLWKQCIEKAEKELLKQLKERESQLTFRPGVNFPPSKIKKKEEENIQKIIIGIAEKEYCTMDPEYNQSLLQVEKECAELIKAIDHALYSIKEPLLRFDRAQGTLLEANWRKVRDYFSVNEIMQFNAQGLVERATDALEAIRSRVKHQPKPRKTKSFWWKLYEKTLKVIVDAVFEKVWPQ